MEYRFSIQNVRGYLAVHDSTTSVYQSTATVLHTDMCQVCTVQYRVVFCVTTIHAISAVIVETNSNSSLTISRSVMY